MAKKLSIARRIDSCYNSLAYLGAALLNEGDDVKAEKVITFMRGLKELVGRPSLIQAEMDLVNRGFALDAIREVRARLGITLKDAKEMVDAFRFPAPP